MTGESDVEVLVVALPDYLPEQVRVPDEDEVPLRDQAGVVDELADAARDPPLGLGLAHLRPPPTEVKNTIINFCINLEIKDESDSDHIRVPDDVPADA